jgi:WD40 repeat protein
VVSGCRDGTVYAWHGSSNLSRENSHFTLDASSWWDWALTSDKSAIISCKKNGTVSEWLGNHFRQECVLLELGEGFYGSCVTDDGAKIAAGYKNGEVKIWDLRRKSVVPPLVKTSVENPLPDHFYDQGRKLAIMQGSWQGGKFLWDLVANRELQTWPHTDNLFSRDGRFYVDVRGESITVRDLQTATDEKLPETIRVDFSYGQVELSFDSRYFARTEGLEVLVWDRVERQMMRPFGRFMYGAVSVNFSPDGRRLVAGGNTFEAIKVWDFSSGLELLTLPSASAPMRYVKFTPDGDLLCARDTAGVLYGWLAPTFDEIERQERAALKTEARDEQALAKPDTP